MIRRDLAIVAAIGGADRADGMQCQIRLQTSARLIYRKNKNRFSERAIRRGLLLWLSRPKSH